MHLFCPMSLMTHQINSRNVQPIQKSHSSVKIILAGCQKKFFFFRVSSQTNVCLHEMESKHSRRNIQGWTPWVIIPCWYILANIQWSAKKLLNIGQFIFSRILHILVIYKTWVTNSKNRLFGKINIQNRKNICNWRNLKFDKGCSHLLTPPYKIKPL